MSLYDVLAMAGMLNNDEPEPSDIIGPAEAAAMLGVAASTLRGYVRRGLLMPAVNLGSDKMRGARHGFRRGDVESFTKPVEGRPRKED